MENYELYVSYCPKCGEIYPDEGDNICSYCREQYIKTKYTYDEYLNDICKYEQKIFDEYIKKSPKFDEELFNKRERKENEIAYGRGTPMTNQQNIPKCPICQSTDLSKISSVHKAGKILMFGIFGMDDNGKTWKCNNCGSKF